MGFFPDCEHSQWPGWLLGVDARRGDDGKPQIVTGFVPEEEGRAGIQPPTRAAAAKFRFFSGVCPGFNSWGLLGAEWDPSGWGMWKAPGIPRVAKISRRTLVVWGWMRGLGRGSVPVPKNGI